MLVRFGSLPDALQAAARDAAPDRGYTFLDGTAPEHLSFADLYRQARQTAGALQGQGVRKGDCVLLDLPTSVRFATVYFGAMLCGAAPCVLPPIESVQERGEALRRVRTVARQVGAKLAVVSRREAYAGLEQAGELALIDPAGLESQPGPFEPVAIGGEDLAVVQASSGTTGTPKCVGLRHGNVLANLHQIGERVGAGSADVVVSWLPMYHDMGLIGCFLWPLYWQFRAVLMTPYRFLRRPSAWLTAISEFRGTFSPAPNFAYALVLGRMSDPELADLDLSSWRSALCGSEQVDVGNLLRFAERFGRCGFDSRSLTPCYGMAEASLAVTIHRPGDPLRFERLLRAPLASEGKAVLASETQAIGVTVVCGCGSALPNVRLSVRDESGSELQDGVVGEIWIRSPSLTVGYVADPDRTRETLRDGWLLSGDLGYLRDGHLFVTGRRKELIVIRGHNYQPADFEWAAAEVPGVRSGKVVAFGAYSHEQATEQLYVVCERPQDTQWTDETLTEAIRAQVARRTGLLPVVGLLPRNAIPKTTSGKLQRGKVKALFLNEVAA